LSQQFVTDQVAVAKNGRSLSQQNTPHFTPSFENFHSEWYLYVLSEDLVLAGKAQLV
jgi:hypothetical protein